MNIANNNIILSCQNLSKRYGPSTVVEDFNLNIKEYEFISIIGHSGCGKSTVMNMIGGLTPITEGIVTIGGELVITSGLDRGIIFQSPNLLPHLTCLENVMIGVDQAFKNKKKNERIDIALHYLEKMGLGSELHKKTTALSEGMKQRVGIARAIAINPEILLLDEPFGMLDSITREELQDQLLEIWQEEKITAILITHDIDEAIFLSDRIVMMTNGPNAKVGQILDIDLPRPRKRNIGVTDTKYDSYRETLIDFLNS